MMDHDGIGTFSFFFSWSLWEMVILQGSTLTVSKANRSREEVATSVLCDQVMEFTQQSFDAMGSTSGRNLPGSRGNSTRRKQADRSGGDLGPVISYWCIVNFLGCWDHY